MNVNNYAQINNQIENQQMNRIKGVTNPNTYNYASPVNYNMGNGVLGSYDNMVLKTTCKQSWMKPPCNPPQKSNLQFVPQGTPLPLKNEEIYSEIPKNSMFIFSNSFASPECCPATFSTDRGCICSSDQLRAFIGERRGGNMSYNNYNF